jgi:hypothetical protein
MGYNNDGIALSCGSMVIGWAWRMKQSWLFLLTKEIWKKRLGEEFNASKSDDLQRFLLHGWIRTQSLRSSPKQQLWLSRIPDSGDHLTISKGESL